MQQQIESTEPKEPVTIFALHCSKCLLGWALTAAELEVTKCECGAILKETGVIYSHLTL